MRVGIGIILLVGLTRPLVWAEPGGSVVAVFDVEIKGFKLKPGVQERLGDYLANRLAASGAYQVIPRTSIKIRLRAQATESTRTCYDEACQIELGREFAAQKTVSTQVMKLGSRCIVSLTLYDLRRAASEGGAEAEGQCTEDGIVLALRQAIARLPGILRESEHPSQAPDVRVAQPGQHLTDLSHWEILDGRWWTEKGVILGSGGHMLLKGEPFGDFVFEMTVEHRVGPRAANSCGFRISLVPVTKKMQGYLYNFAFHGTFMPFRGLGGTWYLVHPDWKSWKQVPVFLNPKVRIRVEARGQHFRLFADDQLMDEFNDADHRVGTLSLAVQDSAQVTGFSELRLSREPSAKE